MQKFINLKLHTEYSLLEGVGKIGEYITKAKEMQLDVLPITDTSMFGVIEFYKKCKEENIKSIIGLEIFLDGFITEGEYSLTLLAKDKIGYSNLSKLSSLSYSRFNRRRNKIKYEELMNHSQGLFLLSGGIYSEVVQGLLNYKYPEVKKIIEKLFSDFKDNFFLEIPCMNEMITVRKNMFEIIKDLGVGYIFSNDVYYANKNEVVLQNILKSIKEGNKLSVESQRNNFNDLYLKDYNEVKELFLEYGDDFFQRGLENIQYIVDNSNVNFEFDKIKFPEYHLPNNITEKEYLKEIVFKGLKEIYLKNEVEYENFNENIQEISKKLFENGFQNVLERIEYELNIIDNMGYNGYFIIVWDFIKFAKEKGVYVGPGRGSAAGSLVSYALNITEIDPLKYNLIFERFLNPERISMPDIDIDFDQEQREIVIDYVLKKYGREYVAHIITFGTLKARAAIRDVGRVLNIDLKKVDFVAKLIPFNVDLKEGLKKIPELLKAYKSDDEIKRMIDYSIKIEGKVRHASVHAAGLVISRDKLDEEIPLYSDGKTDMASTQYQMKELEDLGILKIDFLGLKNLTILRKTVENIEKTRNEKIKLQDIPLDNEETYKLMTSGKTLGIFQCESLGIRKLMKKMKIEKFEDIIALLALYRPGPLRSGMVEDFIMSKNKGSEIKYPDASLKEILQETYGVILYQEQVMRIANLMANYSLGEADELRRAIGKKIPHIIEQNREKFVLKSKENGILETKANEIYNLIDKFGGYGFNKSHSAAYALIVYWTAYFKANYSLEFFSAVMSTEMYNVERLSVFINEAREKGIQILAPSISRSDYEFTVENNAIRFGMLGIKGIGINFVQEIIDERKTIFLNYEDFVYRMKQRGLNKKNLESLIFSGSLDEFKGNKREKYNSIDKILEWANKKYSSEEDLQMILFGGKSKKVEAFVLNLYSDYTENEKLKYEKEYLGIYVSNHILNSKKDILEIVKHSRIFDIESTRERSTIRLIGVIRDVKNFITKRGEPMCKFILEDLSGTIEIICFPREYINAGYEILEDKIVFIEGLLEYKENKNTVILSNIYDIDNLNENKALKLYILMDGELKDTKKLKKIIMDYKGENKIYFAMKEKGENKLIKSDKYKVKINKEFLNILIKEIGIDKIKIN